MTITPAVRIADRKVIVKDRTILTGVPDNVIATSGSSSGPVEGVFIGAEFDQPSSRHVVSLGTLRDVRFMACFRFKLWWMAQKMGDKGGDIPLETQFLLVETKDGSHIESDDGDESNQIIYAVFLPLIEGSFRACLQGNSQDELELSLESGDDEIKATSFTHSLFVSAGLIPTPPSLKRSGPSNLISRRLGNVMRRSYQGLLTILGGVHGMHFTKKLPKKVLRPDWLASPLVGPHLDL